MEKQIEQIRKNFEKALQITNRPDEVENLYLEYFSKKSGKITLLLKELPKLSPEDKQKLGPTLNALQNDLKEQIDNKRKEISDIEKNDPLIDFSLPVKGNPSGMLHPTTTVIRELNDFFRYHGFSTYEGPEIESEEYNFRILNLPEGHPATDLQDSLYVGNSYLLRTHTSSIESRVLKEQKPPIRVAFPGKCYRNESLNATNGAFFYQFQGVVVDKGINLGHLKGTLTEVHKFLFGDDIELRFRYKYYPEVAPGMGVDMKCKFCGGEGCNVCKYRGYIESLGSGMIHPNTLKACGIDTEVYTGYAFGMGLDRLVMQKFGINDIRKLYQGEMAYK